VVKTKTSFYLEPPKLQR